MGPKRSRTSGEMRGLTWTVVAVCICIFVFVAVRSVRVTDGYFSADTPEDTRTLAEPALAETPGGFDPIPEFGATAAEIRYRGASCLRELPSLEAHLYRICVGRD